MHEELLAEVASDWTASGVLPELIGLLRDVWRTNLDRHEPALGDDAVTLGMGSARNYANRTVQEFAQRRDVLADLQGNSLRVVHLGRVLRASKLPGKTVLADPYSIDWDSSATRHQGPAANSQQLQLFEGFESPDVELAANAASGSPRYLHLAWAGDAETGEVAAHLGFPRDTKDGAGPWFAVQLVHRDLPGDQLPIVPAVGYDADRFDQRPVPPIAVRLRGTEQQAAGNDGA
ncbi:hypothetical protein [Streptomyces sp. SID13031]|uniref:hypothetical protein n=1 Tax=Streptomyces sp. SID13031 TaxID=2706046 RepID=UPI0013CCF857|nr:hypothetical protein [Streptomyces sp. SID13031]NEA30099.1 hypothetical protein [Streptomyces sp. SID13031]